MNENLKNHMLKSLEQGVRYDGRDFEEYRPVEIETGTVRTAEGSARVKMGETEVIVGVKMSVGSPFSDRPEEGVIIVNAELLPMSSPEFEPGPPGKNAIEIARVVDRAIRESKAVDLKDLCIEKGEKCWLLNIDVVTLNHEGNIRDAASIGAIAALRDAKFPVYEDGVVDYKKKTDKSVPLTKTPVGVTVIRIGEHLLIDPLLKEEEAADSRLTVATTEDGKLCALQKGEDEALTLEEVEQMVELGMKKSEELRKLLK